MCVCVHATTAQLSVCNHGALEATVHWSVCIILQGLKQGLLVLKGICWELWRRNVNLRAADQVCSTVCGKRQHTHTHTHTHTHQRHTHEVVHSHIQHTHLHKRCDHGTCLLGASARSRGRWVTKSPKHSRRRSVSNMHACGNCGRILPGTTARSDA